MIKEGGDLFQRIRYRPLETGPLRRPVCGGRATPKAPRACPFFHSPRLLLPTAEQISFDGVRADDVALAAAHAADVPLLGVTQQPLTR